MFRGCGGDRGPERVVLAGKVTYNGKPIAEGEIRFVPAASSAVPAAGAENQRWQVQGRCQRRRSHRNAQDRDRSLPSRSRARKPGQPAPPMAAAFRIQYIPKRYNVDSQLQITIEPGSREITKDFDLTD